MEKYKTMITYACSLCALLKCRYVKTDKFVNVGQVPLKLVLLVYALSITENGVKDPRVERAVGVCKNAVSAFSYSCKKRKRDG